MTTTTGSVQGFAVRGEIRGFEPATGIAKCKLPLKQDSDRLYPIKIPAGWRNQSGGFSGGYPDIGTFIYVVQGQANEWVFLAYDVPDSADVYDTDGTKFVNSMNRLKPGRWISIVENDIGVTLSPEEGEGAKIGDATQFIQLDPGLGIFSSRFSQSFEITNSKRSITGPVLRDTDSNSLRGILGSALSGHQYNKSLKEIGLDPRGGASTSTLSLRNPSLTETRSLYYEFDESFGFTNDRDEKRKYEGEDSASISSFQRKKSRTDAVSLSLDHPNFLAESIIGTVVDIYGNILDINRSVLPNGIIESLSFKKSEEDLGTVFVKLREQLRKSIAYHFELNSRKAGLEDALVDYNDKSDYIKERSRFSFDVDKEGQFKLNVPSSSEVGNVPLHVRYDNSSNLIGAENDEDRGRFLRTKDNIDIKLQPYGKGVVNLVSNEETLKSYAAPLDKDGEVIKLGTAYHNIGDVLFPHKIKNPINGYSGSPINKIAPISEVVSDTIIVSGDGANAGGRSGTISLDGSLSLSIGANTVDRQSLWLDLAGGIVGAIGRDRFNRSLSVSFDGGVFVEIGSPAPADDSRFTDNGRKNGVLDIRIFRGEKYHVLRIDDTGVYFHTPANIDIVSEKNIRIKALGTLSLDAANIMFYTENKQPRLLNRSGTTI